MKLDGRRFSFTIVQNRMDLVQIIFAIKFNPIRHFLLISILKYNLDAMRRSKLDIAPNNKSMCGAAVSDLNNNENKPLLRPACAWNRLLLEIRGSTEYWVIVRWSTKTMLNVNDYEKIKMLCPISNIGCFWCLSEFKILYCIKVVGTERRKLKYMQFSRWQ